MNYVFYKDDFVIIEWIVFKFGCKVVSCSYDRLVGMKNFFSVVWEIVFVNFGCVGFKFFVCFFCFEFGLKLDVFKWFDGKGDVLGGCY